MRDARVAVLLAVAAGAVALGAGRRARAQCGQAQSECWACHETRGAHPVGAAAPWHRDHAFADFCARCHGGDPLASDAAAAHAGMVAPLADPDATCAPCHAGDAAARARAYAEAAGAGGAGPVAGSTARTRGAITGETAAATAPSPSPAAGDAVLAALVLAVGLGGAWFVVATERRRRGAPRPRPHPLRALGRPSWSPYAAGAGLGVIVTVSMAVFGHRLTGAGAYQALSGYAGRPLAPDGVYWRYVVPTGLGWEVWLALGTLGGALASALAGRQFRIRTMPDRQWADVFGPKVWVRWAIVFAGTALIQLAGGLAGGCTASLALSGGAVLAPGAFLFIAGMFAGGIPVARLLYRRRGGGS